MRIGIQGWGSEGDLRPLVALAARLRRGGHSPRLVFTAVDGKDYGPLCRSVDVPLRLVPESMPIKIQDLARDAKSSNPSKFLRAVLDLTFFPYVEALYESALALCQTCDVVVGGASSWPVKAAAIQTGVPLAMVDYAPVVIPSRQQPPVLFPPWPWLARPGWALLHVLMDFAFREAPRKFFASKGLPPIRHTIPDVIFSDRLNLHAASPSFWPPAGDWSDIHSVCGEFFMPEAVESWAPSPSLHAFLEDGPPPALLTLGSMEHMAPEKVRNLLVESARHAKGRAIIQTKTSDDEGRDGDLYFLPWAPHHLLAPSCAAIVHHGGAGTTHMALRAGKPSVVLPFIMEQQLWAKRLQHVGAAGKPLSFWKVNPQQVGLRIREALESESLKRAAAVMAIAMASEDGTGVATRRLEALAGEGRPN
jgi:sterol 3beta-glucosyltransferase